jgi:hypothetical protein
MGWERRKGGWYYYRKERRGGRVASRYTGAEGSPLATIAAENDRIRRSRRAGDRALVQAELADLEQAEAGVSGFCDQVEAIVRTALESAGFHRHARGAWRKRRRRTMNEPVTCPTAEPPAEAIRQCISIAAAAERAWLRRICPDAPGDRAALAGQMAELRAELSGPEPPPLERLLVERVALTWVQLMAMESTCASRKLDPAVLARFEKRRDQAHSRYIQAIKAIAQIRRLRLPAVLVNIATAGGQQVNVAGPIPPSLP